MASYVKVLKFVVAAIETKNRSRNERNFRVVERICVIFYNFGKEV